MSILALTATGELPPGIHTATIAKVESVFGQTSDRRRLLLKGLRETITLLKRGKCLKDLYSWKFYLRQRRA